MVKEKVLVVNNAILFEEGVENVEGIIAGNEQAAVLLERIRQHGHFIERDLAEGNKLVQQIVSYVVLMSGDQIFVTRRISGSTEERLHGGISIGIGGHASPVDEEKSDLLEAMVDREFDEEVDCRAEILDRQFVGILHINNTDVDQEHTGLVYLYRADKPDCQVLETHKLEGQWVGLDQLEEHWEQLEEWSKCVYRHLQKKL